MPVQFWHYLVALSHGDLGMSLTTGQPVLTELINRLPASAELTLCGLFLAIGSRFRSACWRRFEQGSLIDHACRIVATAGVLCRCSSPDCCWSMYFISCWAGCPRLWDGWTRSRLRQPR